MNTALVVGITILAYILISVFSNRKALVSLCAAAVLIAIGAAPLGEALRDYVNWNVLAIYVGSLILAELFIYSRVPAVIAEWIADKAPSAAVAIALIAVFTGLVSAFVENVATVLVVAPIAIEIARKVKVPLGPVLVILAVNANLQGMATLVGDPPSMLFAGVAGFSFNDFFIYHGKVSIFFFVQLGAAVGGLFSFWIFRSHSHKEPVARVSAVVSWVPLLLLVGMVAALAWNSLHEIGVGARSGLICLLAALLGQIWFVLLRKEKLREAVRIVRELDWETLFFLAGIFIMLGALNRSGAMGVLAGAMASLFGTNVLAIYVFLVAISVLISGFVDNVPYIALMLPLISRISGNLDIEPTVLYFGLLVGACMGGNVTPFGASANIVATGLARKNGDPVGFGRFVRIGAPFTLTTTAVVATAVWFFWRP